MALAALRAALESERSSLQEIDASIKRIVQAPVPRHNHHDRFNNAGDTGRGAGRAPVGAREPLDGRPDELGKRRHETKTVFSRLSARHDGDSDHEDNGTFAKKPRISSQVTRDLPSKQEIMKAQCGDEQSKVRNRRMFGSLLGTLQKFKQEEIVLKSKEDKKAQVERKIERQAQQERERQRRERQTLFADRELKKATIKALEAKLARVAEFDAWAAGQQALGNFILTRARPHLFWLPRAVDERAGEKLSASRKHHEKYMEKKRQELEEELIRIEQKCLRTAKTPQHATQLVASKENKMADAPAADDDSEAEESSPRKREKFVSEVRVKEENGATVKVEEERERRNSKRERTSSKEHCDQLEKKTTESEQSQRQPEEGEKESRRSEEPTPDKERRESEREMQAAQNGSPDANPAPQEASEELQNNSTMDGGEDEQECNEEATGAAGSSPAARVAGDPATD